MRRRQLRVDADADVAGIVRVQMVEQHLAAEGAADRQRPGFGDAAQIGDRLLAPARAAEDRRRAALAPVSSRRRARSISASPGRVSTGREGQACGASTLVGQHVLRQRDDDRTGTAGRGDGEGAGDEFGNARGVVDLDHPFGDAAEEALVVDLLEGLALPDAARDLADEQDHRRSNPAWRCGCRPRRWWRRGRA